MAVTCVLIACKVEEWQLNAKALLKELQRGAQEATTAAASASSASSLPPFAFPAFPYAVSDVLDCELDVLHRLTFDLVVFHPYRPLLHFLRDFASHPSYPGLLQHSWWLVNDLYYTDLILLYPPYLLACACAYVACHLLAVDYKPWLKQLQVNTAAILDIAQQLLSYQDRRQLATQSSAAAFSAARLLHAALEGLQRHFEGQGAASGGAGADAEATDAVGEANATSGAEDDRAMEPASEANVEDEKERSAQADDEAQQSAHTRDEEVQDAESAARKKQRR